ncbi:Putative ribonuclease H protein At1g65750 [Linum perenne]
MDRIQPKAHLQVGGNWSALWRAKIPPKVKHFIWKLGRNILPTKMNLRQKRVYVSLECGNCGSGVETDWHLFLECPVARECWVKAGIVREVARDAIDQVSFEDWLMRVLELGTEATRYDLLVIMWSIWNERNSRVWKNKASTAEWIVKEARAILADWKQAQRGKDERTGSTITPPCPHWHPPPQGKWKCNLDAAISAALNRSGAGMVVRGSDGRVDRFRMLSWSGTWRSRDAEGRALLEALSWVELSGYSDMTFETDALATCQAMQADTRDLTEFGEIISGCKAIMARNPEFRVVFVRREQNKVADVLAKQSVSYVEPCSGETPPSVIDNVLTDTCSLIHEY